MTFSFLFINNVHTTVLLPSSNISLTSTPMLGVGLDINCVFPFNIKE